jgi:hypothetical protein
MKVLVACEYSGRVRDAFAAKGHYALSCDLLPSESPGHHYQGDVTDLLHSSHNWDMLIAFPPCTYLAASGMHWTTRGIRDPQLTEDALAFVQLLLNAPVKYIALENPVGCISSRIRKPDQYIQPWQFGHGETKKTGLWLKNLPLLTPSNIVDGRKPRVHRLPPSADRWKLRSMTYQGVADAMADQWGVVHHPAFF